MRGKYIYICTGTLLLFVLVYIPGKFFIWGRVHSCTLHCLKKNHNAPRSSEHPPVRGGEMTKRLGWIKGCKYKTSSWHLNGFPDGNNIGSTVLVHSYEDSTIEPYKSRGLGNQKNVGVYYCTISLIVMHGYRTNTEYTRSLGYNSAYRKIRSHLDLLSLLHYI